MNSLSNKQKLQIRSKMKLGVTLQSYISNAQQNRRMFAYSILEYSG